MRKHKGLPRKRKLSEDFSLASKTASAELSDEDDSKGKKTAPKLKMKREPLPMKMRAFPQSFWQEPNASGIVLPTNCCSPLEEENERMSQSYVVGNANTDLLFSLFQNINGGPDKEKPAPVVKRGRPRKAKSPYQTAKAAKDEDPYFTSAIVPVIQVKDEEKIAQEQQVLAFISISGETETLPVNNSYSERLTDLVVNL